MFKRVSSNTEAGQNSDNIRNISNEFDGTSKTTSDHHDSLKEAQTKDDNSSPSESSSSANGNFMVMPRIVRVEWSIPSSVIQDEPRVKVETLPFDESIRDDDEEEDEDDIVVISDGDDDDDIIEIVEIKNEMMPYTSGQQKWRTTSTPIRSSPNNVKQPEKIFASVKLNGEKYFVVKWKNSRDNELGKYLILNLKD